MKPTFVMTRPTHFEVGYAINPWMDPQAWAQNKDENVARAATAWDSLKQAIEAAGGTVVVMEGAEGLPDLVFPANSAVVLDGRALLGRFRYPERRPETVRFARFYQDLQARSLLIDVDNVAGDGYLEGAGDCLWDPVRRLFWGGWGPRSSLAAHDQVRVHFDCDLVSLKLVDPRFYHLDVCLMPLSGGEVAYFPDAFDAQSLEQIRARVPREQRIEIERREAETLALNAVNIADAVITGAGAPKLIQRLEQIGYHCVEVDLSGFGCSGGGAFCLSLRLDLAR